MENNLESIQIDNLRMWRANSWIKYDTNISIASIKLHYDLLLITAGDKVLESISLYSKIKGINKEDCVVLIISTSGKEIRKIKFQIKNNVTHSLKELSTRFPILSYNVFSSQHKATSKFHSIDDLLRIMLDKQVNLVPLSLSPEVERFVKLCLLDPMFPQIVMHIQGILEKETL